MKRSILALALGTALLSSCSIVMASRKEGVEIDSVQTLCTREQLLSLGAEPLWKETNEQGQLIETYRILKERGSVARAFMHALLDFGTVFLWELAGTPIESALDQKKYFSLKVIYDDNERIQKMELL